MSDSPAMDRHNRTIVALSLVYGAALVGTSYAFRHHLASGAGAYALALLPALPIIGIFAAIGRYLVEEGDEYLRMLMVRQTLVASGFAISVATAWGFLQGFDLAPAIGAYWIAILWFGGLGFGACLNRLIEGRGA